MTGDAHDDSPRGGSPHGDRGPLRRSHTLLRLLEQAREQRGSPPLWDAVAARLDEEDRRRDTVGPMLHLLDQIHERVDDQTWQLILDFERRTSHEIVSCVEVGLELGYDHGRTSALMQAQPGQGKATKVLTERLADLLGDAEADYLEILMALIATLGATVMMAREEHADGGIGSAVVQG
jgi:hypothetical protein